MLEKEEKLLSIYRVLKQGTSLENIYFSKKIFVEIFSIRFCYSWWLNFFSIY